MSSIPAARASNNATTAQHKLPVFWYFSGLLSMTEQLWKQSILRRPKICQYANQTLLTGICIYILFETMPAKPLLLL